MRDSRVDGSRSDERRDGGGRDGGRDGDSATSIGGTATGRAGTSRRALLGSVGILGFSAVGARTVAPDPPKRGASVEAAPDADSPFGHDPITDEDASPIARYQYAPTGSGYRPTAPITVVFALADSPFDLSTVVSVLEAAGWTGVVDEYDRFAWDRRRERYVHQQATAAETALGLHGRMHVRCWEFEGVVSMQAHEDTPARPNHGIVSYADASARVAGLFAERGWRFARSVDLRNGGTLDYDGRATVIRPPSDADRRRSATDEGRHPTEADRPRSTGEA